MENCEPDETIITKKNYRNRNEYIRNYQRNRYHTNEAFRLMKIDCAKKCYNKQKERLRILENKYKEISQPIL
jgi:hypothetical protein